MTAVPHGTILRVRNRFALYYSVYRVILPGRFDSF